MIKIYYTYASFQQNELNNCEHKH